MYIESSIYINDVKKIANCELNWEGLKNKSILVVGASGLIGTFLIDVLMLKNTIDVLNLTIYAVGRKKDIAQNRFKAYTNTNLFTFLELDINKPFNIDVRVDYILHAASNTHPQVYAVDPIGTIMTNLLGTYNLLEYSRKMEIERFIFLSTVEIYGQAYNEEDCFDESYCGYIDCNTVRAGYPEGKRAGEALCNAYIEKYGIDIVIPRLSRIYGPTMRLNDSKAVSQFILNGLRNENIVLKSEGKQLYSYCYVADAVMGILYIWLKGIKGEAYNVADVEPYYRLSDIAKRIARLVNKDIIYDLPSEIEKSGFSKVTHGIMNVNKLRCLGWYPYDDLNSGLEKTINIMQYNYTK